MKKTTRFALAALALATTGLMSAPALAQAEKGDWLVRGRILNLDSANKDSTGLNLSVNDKTFVEVDISYFLSPNFALELILALPQEHDVRSGSTKIGTLKHLPPTLSAQYHFTGLGAFRPYVGAGVNYTRFSNVEFAPAVVQALNPSIKKNSYGFSAQVGFDVVLGGGWVLNLDVKKVQIGTDIKSNGNKVGEFKVDPVLFSVGAGLRF